MNGSLTVEQIIENPDCITQMVKLKSGEEVVFRALRPDDTDRFGRYLDSLSQKTRRRYGPHPLNMDAARDLCAHIDPRETLRLIAVTGKGAGEVIAYFILLFGFWEADIERYRGYGIELDSSRDCTFAPSVADAYQNTGVASALIPHTLDILRRLGRQRVILMGGVQATNDRARRFYEKAGFRWVSDFYAYEMNNHDMILTLG